MPPLDLGKLMNKAYHAAFWSRRRFLVLYGGAGSGKSFFAAQKVILRTLQETPHTFLCIRKVAATLRNSVFALLLGVISQWGLGAHFSANKTDMSITCLLNGNQILMSGMDDPEKIKSITGASGLGITGIWIEEATELTPQDLNQLNLRIRGMMPNYKQLILSFNPINEQHHLKKRFFDRVEPNSKIVHTTYLDNRFIDDDDKAELDRLSEIDPALYRIYALGQWGTLKGVIYSGWQLRELLDAADDTFYGLDFGFNNPMALVRIDMRDREVFLSELIYRSGMTTEGLAEAMRELGIGESAPVYADAAEPDRIQQLCDAGFNVLPAKKGPGSVNAGIIFVKAQKIYVQPGSDNILAEAGSYKWREDKSGNVLDEPAKFNDHAMDALRYGLFTHLSQDSSFEVSFL